MGRKTSTQSVSQSFAELINMVNTLHTFLLENCCTLIVIVLALNEYRGIIDAEWWGAESESLESGF